MANLKKLIIENKGVRNIEDKDNYVLINFNNGKRCKFSTDPSRAKELIEQIEKNISSDRAKYKVRVLKEEIEGVIGVPFETIYEHISKVVDCIASETPIVLITRATTLLGFKNTISALLLERPELRPFLDYVVGNIDYIDLEKVLIPKRNLKLKLTSEDFLSETDFSFYTEEGQKRSIGDARDFLEYVMTTLAHRHLSDCSMAVNSKVKYRYQKRLIDDEEYGVLTYADMLALQDEILNQSSASRRDEYKNEGCTRVTMTLKDCGRYRITLAHQRGTPTSSRRHIPFESRDLADFRLPKITENRLLSGQGGLYMIVGEPNSGKSTLASSVIDRYTRTTSLKVVTLERPIEYLFGHHMGLTNQIEIGEDCISYEKAIEMLLTFDPDIVYFTEVRNRHELLNAIEMAVAGKYVITSGHAQDVKEWIMRCRGFLDNDKANLDKYVAVTRMILVQKLVPKVNGGLIPVQEIFNIYPDNRTALTDPQLNNLQSLLINQRDGNRLMLNDFYNLEQQGLITKETLETYANTDKKDITTFQIYSKELSSRERRQRKSI